MDDQEQAVWLGLPQGSPLQDLLGSSSSLHDARVLRIGIAWEGRMAEMLVQHTDLAPNSDQEQTLYIRLRWTGVVKLDLLDLDNWLYGVHFRANDEGRTVTEFEQGFGIHGMVEAEGVEAFLVGSDPLEFEHLDPDALRIEVVAALEDA